MLERRENETPLEYHKRLVYGKLVDKTLSDVDYTELSPLVYGKGYSADVARRMLYGSCVTLQLMDEEREAGVTDAGAIHALKQQKVELEKERQRFFDQRREYKKLVAVDGRREHLAERLVKAAEELGETVGDAMGEVNMPVAEYGENEAVLVFSDWHYGMVAKNVFNAYNTAICRERVRKVVDEAVQRITLHKCRTLHVFVLGDLYHGAIHTSARVMSEELVCDQLIQATEILAQAVLRLSKFVEKTNVYTTYGNHARTVQNKAESVHSDNMERIIPWWLEQRFRGDENITVVNGEDCEDGFIVAYVCGHGFCAAHGDLDCVKTSPRLLPMLFKRVGIDVEYILLGDKHHTEVFDELGVYAEIVPSLCGTDDYANEHRLYSDPGQLLMIVNVENGVDAEYRLKVGWKP